MYIKLKWTNLNTGAFTTNIYRDTVQIDRANLGTPIVSLTQGESEYQDNDVVRGQQYYYVFETLNAGDRSVSINYAFKAIPRRGAGPNDIVIGDYEYGYFGTLLASDFIATADLMARVGFSGGTVQNVAPTWYKYARAGKVLYVPNKTLVSGISWTSIYNAGLVYGVDGPGKGTVIPTTPVNQLKKVTIGSDEYIVRLMTGYSDNPADIPPTGTVADPTDGFRNEFDDLIYPLGTLTPNKQRMVNIANFTMVDLGLSSGAAWTQELVVVSTGIVRGSGNSGRAGLAQRASTGVSGTSNVGWYPVLELVEA